MLAAGAVKPETAHANIAIDGAGLSENTPRSAVVSTPAWDIHAWEGEGVAKGLQWPLWQVEERLAFVRKGNVG